MVFNRKARTCVFTPSGKHLVSGSLDKTVKVWEVATEKCVKTIPTKGQVRKWKMQWTNDKVYEGAISRDNAYFVAILYDNGNWFNECIFCKMSEIVQ